jgi:hypothetical protein
LPECFREEADRYYNDEVPIFVSGIKSITSLSYQDFQKRSI